ncbi:SGNH/GDSL hydrolase family protein [Rapidithrix thailandica]|uniref:SGNH/GDSL hydrolase family protein n=1 Tax=Rapidithrix thailandica TaxID=413964 RepID=A0AAW9S7U7_9BACT
MDQDQLNSRRGFLKKATVAGAVSVAIPNIISSVYANTQAKKVSLSQGGTVLFQGDSITDAGRNRDNTKYNDSNSLGSGYALLAASSLLHSHPEKDLKVFNKGISGNKVFQLAERWETDCLDLQPHVLSILIGVNDFWHTLTNNYKGTIETYRNDLIALLERTKEKLPDVQLIIGEPFAVKGIRAVDDSWYPAFDEYRAAAREIAGRFNAVFIPYQSIFDKAQKEAPGVYWTHDGVHPSLAGAELMAQAWLKAVR